MSPSCRAGRHDAETALVLCVSEEAARAHRQLFSLPAEVYLTLPAGLGADRHVFAAEPKGLAASSL